jgi:hypothetical protein
MIFSRWLRSPALLVPLAIFIFTRVIVLLALISTDLIQTPAPTAQTDAPEGFWALDPSLTRANLSQGFFQAWYRWDSTRYLDIAVGRGYWYEPGEVSTVAFFPVYPMLIRAFTFGSTDPNAAIAVGMLISNAALLASLILLYALGERLLNRLDARRAALYMALFPASVFFSAVYTESLFLLLTLLMVWALQPHPLAPSPTHSVRGEGGQNPNTTASASKLPTPNWLIVGLAGLLATATRPTGVFTLIFVGYEWLRQINAGDGSLRGLWAAARDGSLWRAGLANWRTLLCIALIPCGLLLFMGYLWLTFGDAALFWRVQSEGWDFESIGPLAVLVRDAGLMLNGVPTSESAPVWWGWIDFGAFFLTLAACVTIWRRIGWGYALYCAVTVLALLNSRSISMVRYVVVLFPVFWALGVWGRRRMVDRLLTTLFMLGLALSTALFIKWYFVG